MRHWNARLRGKLWLQDIHKNSQHKAAMACLPDLQQRTEAVGKAKPNTENGQTNDRKADQYSLRNQQAFVFIKYDSE
jgi:hypothetical protein